MWRTRRSLRQEVSKFLLPLEAPRERWGWDRDLCPSPTGPGGWHQPKANAFSGCPRVAHIITSHVTAPWDRHGGAGLLRTAGFLGWFGARHPKLSSAEEEEWPALSYRRPGIKPVATFAFSQSLAEEDLTLDGTSD